MIYLLFNPFLKMRRLAIHNHVTKKHELQKLTLSMLPISQCATQLGVDGCQADAERLVASEWVPGKHIFLW
jgi:hypothetical protein